MNGGNAYLERKLAAEAFAEQIITAANNPAISKVFVQERLKRILVDPVAGNPFTIQNEGYDAAELARLINARL